MNWIEAKKALNSSIGTDEFVSLDILLKNALNKNNVTEDEEE
mgnify:CR=1 FL=1